MIQLFAAEAAEVVVQATSEADKVWAKSIMLGLAFGAAAIGLGMVGSNYMKALGRNPESGKAASQIIIIAAMIELTALLAFLLAAFLLG
jgi:F0F1-type ATP synthase membrane subunit c/vacuolar-type H+-ATPase subunit K